MSIRGSNLRSVDSFVLSYLKNLGAAPRGRARLREHAVRTAYRRPDRCPGVVSVRSRIVIILDLRPDRRRDHCIFILPDDDRKGVRQR